MTISLKVVSTAVALVICVGVTAAIGASVNSHSAIAIVHAGAYKPTISPTQAEPVQGVDEKEHSGEAKLSAAISAAEARAAAVAAHSGSTAGPAELEDEDGAAVFGIEVTAADGKKFDVKVDAKSGRVVKSDPANDNGEGKDGDEGENED